MSRRNIFRIAIGALVAALIAAGIFAFRSAGRWLVCQDALRPADVIVVLSGGMPWRAEEAARLFRMGYAHEVWITHAADPAQDLTAMGIPFKGEDEYSREVLLQEGAPAADIRILPGRSEEHTSELQSRENLV